MPPLSAPRATECCAGWSEVELVSRIARGGSSAGQSSGLIIRQVVGSNPTRPTKQQVTWVASTPGRHIGYESWLERDHAMLLDFDPGVVEFSPQPFWLFYRGDRERVGSHAPDFFARRADGTGAVLDCRPDERIKPRDAVAFEAMGRACELVGWDYRRCGAVEQPLLGNVGWLAGYRHPRFADHRCSELLRSVFAVPRRLFDGVRGASPSVRRGRGHRLSDGRAAGAVSPAVAPAAEN